MRGLKDYVSVPDRRRGIGVTACHPENREKAAKNSVSVLFTFGLFAPGALFAYWIFNGHVIAAVLGSLAWFPVLWLFLVEVHTMGRVRFWLSAPVMFVGHVVIALWFAGLL